MSNTVTIRFGDWKIILSEDSKPRELMIELTTECNLNCLHCFRRVMSENFGHMSREIMNRILSEIDKLGIKNVSLSGWGEPLYHPDAIWFIRELKSRGVKVLLNTNGTLLSKYADELVKLGIDQVIVSVDAVAPEVYERIRIGGTIDNCISGLKALLNAKEKYGSSKPLIGIQFTLNTINYNQIRYLLPFAREFGIGIIYINQILFQFLVIMKN